MPVKLKPSATKQISVLTAELEAATAALTKLNKVQREKALKAAAKAASEESAARARVNKAQRELDAVLYGTRG